VDDEGSLESNSNIVLKFVNYSRRALYGIAVWVQLSILLVCTLSAGTCDPMTVLVPVFLIFTDMLMITWSRKPFSGFLIVSVVVSIMSLSIAMNTIYPRIILSTFLNLDDFIMVMLGLGVLFVSFIDLLMLIYLTRPQEEQKKDTEWSDTMRTYDAQ